jgi:hypothetical protein
VDSSFSCAIDEYGSTTPEADEATEAAEDEALYERRDVGAIKQIHPGKILEERGSRRELEVSVTIASVLYTILVRARIYPGSTHLHDLQTNSRAIPPGTNVYRSVY